MLNALTMMAAKDRGGTFGIGVGADGHILESAVLNVVVVGKDRVMRTLRLLPRSEVDDIMEKNENIEVKCEFCGKRYAMTPDAIKAQLDESPKEAK